ncbi:MAG: hypothetical protein PSW75_06135 [bacterium]|nr:hypothetical protein [bacterium]MDI1337880.1 hypothetical protein [Lacunisphaera sp.]
MGFDQNSRNPLIVPRRWTTKVNVGMVMGVLLFLSMGMLAITYWTRQSRASSAATPVATAVKNPAGPP